MNNIEEYEKKLSNEIEKLQKFKRIKDLEKEYTLLVYEKICEMLVLENELVIGSNKLPYFPVCKIIATTDTKILWFTHIISKGKLLTIFGTDSIKFKNFKNRRRIKKIVTNPLNHSLDNSILQDKYTCHAIFEELFI